MADCGNQPEREIGFLWGIDPGFAHTGIVVCDKNLRVKFSCVVEREQASTDWMFLNKCIKILEELKKRYTPASIYVEGVKPPQTHIGGRKNLLNPTHIVGLAFVAGGIYQYCSGTCRECFLIPPGGNGSGMLDSYPKELRGKRPQDLDGFGGSSRKHERSAYDVLKIGRYFK